MNTLTVPHVSKTLSHLLPELANHDIGSRIAGPLRLDSRQLNAGDIFVAIKGSLVDGRDFIPAAIEKQASVILLESTSDEVVISWSGDIPHIAIPRLHHRLSDIAGRYYGDPSKSMAVIGITGTNGKTTCSLLAGQLLARIHGISSVVGTTGYGVLNATALAPMEQQLSQLTNTGLTTPDPIALQRILSEMRDGNATTSAIEVSSHSLVQQRVAGIRMTTAVFTNLTQDHLDFHGDLASYGEAKAQLLFFPELTRAVINIDDSWAVSLCARVPAGVTCITYSIHGSADVWASDIEMSAAGTTAIIHSPWGTAALRTSLFGHFNLSNLLAVIASVASDNVAFESLIAHCEHLVAAPGRMQSVVVDLLQAVHVIVDYAHTPDALDNTLTALTKLKEGRIWTVFGCGGDRDKTKRPVMGEIAERLSDCVIVTNDNPRSEDPAAIAADIVKGFHNPRACLVIADRAQAIDFAIQQANADDIVLIAGKGHENYQVFAHHTVPFSDTQQARLALQRRLVKADNDEGALS